MPAMDLAMLHDRRRIALVASGVVSLVALLVLLAAQTASTGADYTWLILTSGVALYTATGIVILWQRPGHGIGRLTLAIGLAFASVAYIDMVLAILGPEIVTGPDAMGPPDIVRSALAALRELVAAAAIWGGGVLLVTWFPDGRPTGIAGLVVTWLLVVTGLLVLIAGVVDPIVRYVGLDAGGAFGDLGTIGALSATAAIATIVAAFAIAVVDLAMRYRRTDAMRRAQIRWVIAAAGLGAVLTLLVILTGLGMIPVEIPLLWDVWIFSLMLPVLAIGVAVTRYHLYDIDRIVSSTIAYFIVSLVLIVVFAALIVGLQAALASFTNGETIAVAASTLLAASLFQPVRSRVQASVDRRFHRARYDADRAVADFASRLRGEIDLMSVRREFETAAAQAVEPAASATWLRPGNVR